MKGLTRRWSAAAALVCAVMLAGACGGDSDTNAAGASGDDKTKAKLSIGLPGIPPVYASVMAGVADKQGFYDKHGVDVELRPFETGTDATRAVQSGQIDSVLGPAALFFTVTSQDVPLVAAQGMDVVDWLVASSDPSVSSCEDLKGQAIGVDKVGGARYLVIEQILDSCGLTAKDVKPLAFPGAQAIQAMVSGQLKVSVLHLDELASIEKQGKKLTVIKNLRDVNPVGLYLVLAAQKSNLEKKRDAFVGMVAAHIEAVRFMNDPANKDAVAEIGTMSGQDKDTAAESLQRFLEIEFWPKDRLGLTEDAVTAAIKDQVEVGNIEKGSEPAYSDIVDESVFEDAMAKVGQG